MRPLFPLNEAALPELNVAPRYEKRGPPSQSSPEAGDSGPRVKRQWRFESSLFLTNAWRCG